MKLRAENSWVKLPYDGHTFWITTNLDVRHIGFYFVGHIIEPISESNMRYALAKITEMERFCFREKS